MENKILTQLKRLKKSYTIGIITTGIITAGIIGYHMGKYNYEPTHISNVNANPEGPLVINVSNERSLNQKVFIEQENGSFIWEKDKKNREKDLETKVIYQNREYRRIK